MKKNTGITLLALIITIIIMLILAGVTISIVGGSDGIVTKAEQAVSKTDKAAMQEDAELSIAAIKMDYYEDYAANRAKYANAKAFIIAKLQTAQKTSRGATMVADSEGNITYTYKGIATAITIDENGKVTLGESSGSEDKPEQGGTEEPPVEEGPTIVVGTREDWSIKDDGTLTLFKGTVPADGTLVIPSVVDGIVVKKIETTNNRSIIYNANEASFGIYNTSVKNIIISEGIESVGKNAFSATLNLENVTLSSDVTSIDESAFWSCTNLSSINITDSVTSIGDYAFYECTNLSTINLMRVESIGLDAFLGCTSLSSISMPSVESIGYGAFLGCTNLSSINIPASVITIETNAFAQCTNLTTVNYGGTRAEWNALVANIGDGNTYLTNATVICQGDVVGNREDWDITDDGQLTLFKGTFPSDGILVIPNVVDGIAVKKVGHTSGVAAPSLIYNAAEASSGIYNTGVKKVIISEGIEVIVAGAFQNCIGIQSVEIPQSAISIETQSFAGCRSLSNINIPDSVIDIGSSAFYGTVWYNNQPDGVVFAGKVLYNYKGTMPSNTSITINEGTKGIAENAFSRCTNLSSINIPDSVISIGTAAFSGCTSLNSINIPDGVISIGVAAFSGCTSLSNINIPDSVINMCSSAFYDTAWYNSQPEGVVYIGKVLYKYKGTMTSNMSITVDAGTKGIAASAFSDCDKLSTINLPSSIINIGDQAFYSCDGLSSINIPNGMVSIGERAFVDCKKISNISIPESVTSIGYCAFEGWTESQTINCEILEKDKPSTWDVKWDYYGYSTARKAQLNWGVSM